MFMAGNFECIQCGKCCLGIGSIVKMERQLSRFGFVVKNDVVKEMRQALITPEYREIFESDHSIQEQHPAACYFVRRLPTGKYVCTIHPYRLLICSSYHCCSARISRNGEEVGKVKGRVSPESKDENLLSLWREKITPADDPTQEYIASVLKDGGYEVLFYDGE